MSRSIHPTALVDPGAELAGDVEVGPFAIVKSGAVVGTGCRIGPRVTLESGVRLAEQVVLGDGCILGGAPQDIKYKGEATTVEIGARTIIREYSTISRGSAATGRTVVGADCFLMTYVHLGHDCVLGDGVTIANATQCAGHVTIESHATLSGLNAVHQFVTIGCYAFVGGATRVSQDVPPYVKAAGNPMELYGLNVIGLRRAGFSAERIALLKRAYRLCFNADLRRAEAADRIRSELAPSPEIDRLLAFLEQSTRGVPA